MNPEIPTPQNVDAFAHRVVALLPAEISERRLNLMTLLHLLPRNYPGEVAALREALIDGKINGSVYSGDCACLFGTIAKVRHCDVKELKGVVRPNSNRPIEVFFYSIQVGNTPKNSRHAKCAVEWIDQFVELAKTAGKVLAKAK